MKEIIIKELSLYNFKGQTRTFHPNRDRTFVKGANGIGKTSLYKAFCWLITSYTDATNVKNHELYDSRTELTPTTPEARVVAVLDIDGVEYKIERRAKAKFSRKRGSSEWTKDSSDSYTILIDDIETSVANFNSWLERNIGQPDIIPYMLIGERFANLTIEDKKDARKVLEKMVGEIDIDSMHDDYSSIREDLKKYTIDELNERYKSQIKPLVNRFATIDALIETKEKEMDEFSLVNFDEIQCQIDAKKNELSALDESIHDKTKAMESLICQRENIIKEIHKKSVILGDMRFEYNSKFNNDLREIEKQISLIDDENKEIDERNLNAKREYERVCDSLEAERKSLDILFDRRKVLIERLNEVKSRVFSDDKCQYCGQELPEFDLQKEKLKFNKRKEEDLKSINDEGILLKERIDATNNNINELEKTKSYGFSVIPSKSKENLIDHLDIVKNSRLEFNDTKECIDIIREIEELKESIPNIAYNDDDLKEKRKEVLSDIEKLNIKLGVKFVKEQIQKDIDNLRLEKRNLGSEIVRIECCISEVKRYEDERASIVSERINKKLKDCEIVMYSKQKDGSIKPDCVIVNKVGVKYATLNNSARIATCLSIQRMFCEHFGLKLPIFVDEASIFDSYNTPQFDTQMIYLVASDDKTLIVE